MPQLKVPRLLAFQRGGGYAHRLLEDTYPPLSFAWSGGHLLPSYSCRGVDNMSFRSGVYSFSVNIICLILLVGNLVYLIIVWGSIPEQIPAHFDGAGNITRYGGKGELLIMPIINWAMFVGISLIERFPKIWNTGVRVTEENRWRIYRIIKNLIVTEKLAMVAPFVFISICQSRGLSLPGWFLPVFLFLCFAPIVFFIVKLIKAQ